MKLGPWKFRKQVHEQNQVGQLREILSCDLFIIIRFTPEINDKGRYVIAS